MFVSVPVEDRFANNFQDMYISVVKTIHLNTACRTIIEITLMIQKI